MAVKQDQHEHVADSLHQSGLSYAPQRWGKAREEEGQRRMTYILEGIVPTKVTEVETVDVTNSNPLLHDVGDLSGSPARAKHN